MKYSPHASVAKSLSCRCNCTGSPNFLRSNVTLPASNQARIAGRKSFDAVAGLYDKMRPGYPQAVFDDVLAISGSRAGSRLFEIGCGSGHATFVFARRGFRIDCIELGANMAALARERLAPFDRVNITIADFDLWSHDRDSERQYDLVYSATAYHWLNPATRVERIARLLAPGGWLAVWRNHQVRGSGASEEFFREARKIYAREAPALAAKFTGPLEPDQIPPTEKEEWLASGLFRNAQTRVYVWARQYTATEYVRMLDTHSDHRLMAEANRGRLFSALARLAADMGGSVTREHATILHMAQKKI
jgi:SAM-dependent methyltransferase